MTARERLADMLMDHGFAVDPQKLHPVAGFWKRADVYRWEGTVGKAGVDTRLYSWDTMTKCAKHGINVSLPEPTPIDHSGGTYTPLNTYEVFARQCQHGTQGRCPGKRLCPQKGPRKPECFSKETRHGKEGEA